MPAQLKKIWIFQGAEISTAFAITKVSSLFEPGEKIDYNETKTMYKKFWTIYQDCFVFKINKKFSISIDQMNRAPKD